MALSQHSKYSHVLFLAVLGAKEPVLPTWRLALDLATFLTLLATCSHHQEKGEKHIQICNSSADSAKVSPYCLPPAAAGAGVRLVVQ